MTIFVKGSEEERDIAEIFLKIKDNEKIFSVVFDQGDYQLINKCLRELKSNFDKQEKIKDPVKEKNKEYVNVLKRTRERFSRYFHFYSLYEIQLLEEIIKKFENEIKN